MSECGITFTCIYMASSGEIWVSNKFSELANRCGVRPSVANVSIDLKFREPSDDYYYLVSYVDSNPRDEKEAESAEKFEKMLGFDKANFIEFSSLSDVEDFVDNALSVAPRARVRDR